MPPQQRPRPGRSSAGRSSAGRSRSDRLRSAAAARRTAARLAGVLRQETVGGVLMLLATALALVLANTPAARSYLAVRDTVLGPAALHLDLTVGQWASDGLLAIFFFVAGLELKREFVTGDLSDPRAAAVPVAAAVGGMAVPALLFVLVDQLTGAGAGRGWAVPTATDIAFALAVLAVVGRHLPSSMRTFLLTLAVVDDLLAIVVIAVFYTAHLDLGLLALTALPLLAFGVAVRRGVRSVAVLLPLALLAWALMHASGVHATVAGVLLAFTVPVRPGRDRLANLLDRRLRPVSAGLAVPVFAFFAAGVSLGGWDGFVGSLTEPITGAVVVALVIGKTIGITGATALARRITGRSPTDGLTRTDMLGLAMLGGIGFTVSLLVAELAFGVGTAAGDQARVGILVGSALAAVLAGGVLQFRNSRYRRLAAPADGGRLADSGDRRPGRPDPGTTSEESS